MSDDSRYNEDRLPKWAQRMIQGMRHEIAMLERDRESMAKASHVLSGKRWFTVPGPKGDSEVYHLWFLYPDHPHPACSLHKDDVLLIGRAEKEVQS